MIQHSIPFPKPNLAASFLDILSTSSFPALHSALRKRSSERFFFWAAAAAAAVAAAAAAAAADDDDGTRFDEDDEDEEEAALRFLPEEVVVPFLDPPRAARVV